MMLRRGLGLRPSRGQSVWSAVSPAPPRATPGFALQADLGNLKQLQLTAFLDSTYHAVVLHSFFFFSFWIAILDGCPSFLVILDGWADSLTTIFNGLLIFFNCVIDSPFPSLAGHQNEFNDILRPQLIHRSFPLSIPYLEYLTRQTTTKWRA